MSDIKDYDFSSWGEFAGTVDPAFQICDTATVLRRVPYEQLKDLMNEMLPSDTGTVSWHR